MTERARPADAEALDRVIRARRSARRFSSEAVSRDAVADVVEAGRQAPYAGLSNRGATDFRRFFAIARGSAVHALLRERIRAVVGAKADAFAAAQADPDPRAAGMLAAMRGIAEKGPPPWDAAWLLVVAERRGFPPREGQALAHALENMWLEATALGLGLQLVSAVEDLSDDDAACAALGLRTGEFLLGACLLGPSADLPRESARTEPELRLTWFA